MASAYGVASSCMVSSHWGFLPGRLPVPSGNFPADKAEAAFLFVMHAWKSVDITCVMLYWSKHL